MSFLLASFASADQAVYKCGQELTNQPAKLEGCQRLETSSPLQIEGTKVQATSNFSGVSKSKQPPVEGSSNSQLSPQEMHQRHAHARTILEDERQKLVNHHAELVRVYKQGHPDLLEGESRTQAQYLQRLANMKSSMLRVERDLQALQRELARYGAPVVNLQMK